MFLDINYNILKKRNATILQYLPPKKQLNKNLYFLFKLYFKLFIC